MHTGGDVTRNNPGVFRAGNLTSPACRAWVAAPRSICQTATLGIYKDKGILVAAVSAHLPCASLLAYERHSNWDAFLRNAQHAMGISKIHSANSYLLS